MERHISAARTARRAESQAAPRSLAVKREEQLRLLSPDASLIDALIERGYSSIAVIAETAREDFIQSLSGLVQRDQAISIYTTARAQHMTMNAILTSLRAEQFWHKDWREVTEQEQLPISSDYRSCDTVGGPNDYLDALLKFAVATLRYQEKPIDEAWLGKTFCQPFAQLVTDCAASTAQLWQVRVCIEVLRTYLQNTATSKSYLERSYADLLLGIGTSYDELQQAQHAPEKIQRELAARLGIALEHLASLFVPASKITEGALASLFGLAVTQVNPPPVPPVEPSLLTWRQAYLHNLWRQADYPPDPAVDHLPLIDPDLIEKANLVEPYESNPAYNLWDTRSKRISEELLRIETLRKQQPTEPQGFNVIVLDILGIDADAILTLAEERSKGKDINKRLQELALAVDAFNYLVLIAQTLKDLDSTLLADEWTAVYAILVQVWKRRQYATWRQEESDRNICLSPDFFQPPVLNPEQFPPSPPYVPPQWRGTVLERQAWLDTLQSRIDQQAQLPQALHTVVGRAENNNLPMLRNDLILAIKEGGPDLDSKAAWFTDNFQIDASLTSTQLTTRIGQAIETLQGLLWAIRIGQFDTTHPELTIDSSADFDEVWPWIGSFVTWRASQMVLYYPENFMQPGLRTHQTPAFQNLVAATGASPSLNPQQARSTANIYAAYYQDICTLSMEVACQAKTRVAPDGDPSGAFRALYYMFGTGGTSRNLYWSTLDPEEQKEEPDYAQSSWVPVPGIDHVVNAVGAAPYAVESTLRYILLFVLVSAKGGTRKLVVTKYNLEKRAWDAEPTDIEAPLQATNFSVIIEQRSSEIDAPPALIARLSDGKLFQTTLTGDGTILSPQGWVEWNLPFVAGNLGVHALVRASDTSWWLVARVSNGTRVFGPNGAIGNVVAGQFLGVLNFPGFNAFLIYKMNVPTAQARYALLTQPDQSAVFDVPGMPLHVAVNMGFGATDTMYAAWYTSDAAFYCNAKDSGRLIEIVGNPIQATPSVKGPFQITDVLTEEELQKRRVEIDKAFETNKNAPAGIRNYLEEAYYFVPIQLASQLQSSGQYINALDWLRTVYDYTLPQLPAYLRQQFTWTAQRFLDWLRDPLDASRIMMIRPAALTRFVLLAEIRCFLAYADSEFSRDTAESVPRARSLYINANRLLNVLKNMPPDSANQLGKVWQTLQHTATAKSEQDQRAYTEQQHTFLLTDPGIIDLVRQVGESARMNVTQRFPWLALLRISPAFITPPNPVVQAYYLHMAVNLYKLRNGCNIAGMVRQLDPYAVPLDVGSGFPIIGGQEELALPAPRTSAPTLYRYSVLIERAKQLVGLATQIETAMLAALEKRDAEYYTLMRARQDLGLAQANVQLQDLRVREAQGGIVLAQLSQQRAQIQTDYYQARLNEGVSETENASLRLMESSVSLQLAAGGMNFLAAALPASITVGFPPSASISTSPQGAAMAVASGLSSLAGADSTRASILSTMASYERRQQEWEQQKNVSAQDALIGAQQVITAQDHVRVVGQDRNIAALQSDNASINVEYLANKFTNVALYEWMSQVLIGVYRSVLQQATAIAQTAASQLSFERQQTPPATIKADYWEMPPGGISSSNGDNSTDKKGLTGSYRLLQDIYRLDEYAFATAQRKLQLTKTISLARLAPAEFQRLKESGTMLFATPAELFDRDFPGQYLRLINRVRVSVIALVPATDSIKATLASSGTSRVVVGSNDVFRAVVINRPPDLVALTSPRDATGLFELQTTQSEMLLPFEGTGVDSIWQFAIPRANNQFDYNTIADVLLTVEYTALYSATYREQIVRSFAKNLSADRPFSFRQELPDQWYDLHNPDQTATPMTVQFTTRRADFPPNLNNLKISQVALYFRRSPHYTGEIPVENLLLTVSDQPAVGGPATTIDGVASTLRGNAPSWMALTTLSPEGQWELAFPNTSEIKKLFSDGMIEDILFDITYAYRTLD